VSVDAEYTLPQVEFGHLEQGIMNIRASSFKIAVHTAPIVAAAVAALVMLTTTPRSALATPEFAKKTGQPCTKCHSAPPVLNDYGKKYKSSLKK